jgi:hypothetical protein
LPAFLSMAAVSLLATASGYQTTAENTASKSRWAPVAKCLARMAPHRSKWLIRRQPRMPVALVNYFLARFQVITAWPIVHINGGRYRGFLGAQIALSVCHRKPPQDKDRKYQQETEEITCPP